MRLPLIPLCVCALALLAACDENGVRITSSTTSTDDGGVLKVVSALQCPDTMGALTRKGSAQSNGTVCIYTGPRGAEVELHLVSLGDQSAAQVLQAFETRLVSAMPHTAAQMTAETARRDAEAASADAEAARGDAEAARADAEAAGAEADASSDRASVRGPGMQIDADGDKARVRMPGISVDANGDKANVRIGGFTINADDSGSNNGGNSGSGGASVHGTLNDDQVSIQAHDDAAEIRTRASGDATRQTYLLTDNRPSAEGWRLVGYEARGPQGGPVVVATVRAKERNSDGVFDDAKDLVSLNVGE